MAVRSELLAEIELAGNFLSTAIAYLYFPVILIQCAQ